MMLEILGITAVVALAIGIFLISEIIDINRMMKRHQEEQIIEDEREETK